MAGGIFSVPIFFIVFRETLEAAIIISVLLGLVEQIVRDDSADGGARVFITEKTGRPAQSALPELHQSSSASNSSSSDEDERVQMRRLVRRLRVQIFLGAALGLLVALAIGAAFIAVWFTEASNLWAKSEALWEGVFSIVASLIILAMGITMLKLDRAKAKWRVKLMRAFAAKTKNTIDDEGTRGEAREGKTGRWILFVLPFITVLREGMEAVVFVGGVSLGQSARSIPIAAIVGIVCGLICGFLIYAFASRTTLTIFLVVMTNFILLIGAGLFSKAVGSFEKNSFNHLLGADVDDAGGNGPGSYDVRGSVWHIDCCNPEDKTDNSGWGIFSALFGWTNSASIGTVLSYIFYWLAVIVILVYMKFTEGRTTLLGKESKAGARLRERRETKNMSVENGSEKAGGEVTGVTELLR